MNLRISGVLASAAFAVACLLGSAQTLAPKRLHHQRRRQQRVGDQHGDEYGDRDNPRRLLSRGRSGHLGRQQRLVHQPRRNRVGHRHGDQYGHR